MPQPEAERPPHPLRVWRGKQKPPLSQEDFALKVGSTTPSISRIENGRQTPSVALIRKIVEATKGAVSANMLVKLPDPRESNGDFPSSPISLGRHYDGVLTTVNEA